MNKAKDYFSALCSRKLLQKSVPAAVNNPPLILFGIAVIAYGFFSAQQGFAWDDWGFAWMPRFTGANGLHKYYAIDRPFLAYLFTFTTSFVGPSPFLWQLFAIFWRAMSSVALWWSLTVTWPEHRKRAFLVALFSLLYPGFSQHSIAIAYGHYSLLQTAFWVSIGLMVLGVKSTKWKWGFLAASLILSAWQLFSAEYYFGLEILRPILLWIAFSKAGNSKERLKKTVIVLTPYILIDAFFLYWRAFIFGFHSYQPGLINDVQGTSQYSISHLPITIFNALITTTIRAWAGIFHEPTVLAAGTRLFIAVSLVMVGVYCFLYSFLSKQEDGNEVEGGALHWSIAAGLSLITAGVPFYITQLPISLVFPNNRFTMPFVFGSSVLLALALEQLSNRTFRTATISIIAVLALGTQIEYGYQFRQDWNLQKSFFWQMVWRIPNLKKGTTLLSDDSAIKFSTDSSLTFPINWIYNPINPDGEVVYNYYYISSRLGGGLPSLKKGLPIVQSYRMTTFYGSTDKIVVIQFSPPSCLHILDPIYYQDLPAASNSIDTTKMMLASGIPMITRRTGQALFLSNTTQIISTPGESASLPQSIFGKEIHHNWCYYFQKADLARQQGNWQGITEIGDQVFAIPYYPEDASEFLPFIEAYARVGKLDTASKLTMMAVNKMPVIRPAICATWMRVEQTSDDQKIKQFANEMKAEIQYCPIEEK